MEFDILPTLWTNTLSPDYVFPWIHVDLSNIFFLYLTPRMYNIITTGGLKMTNDKIGPNLKIIVV